MKTSKIKSIMCLLGYLQRGKQSHTMSAYPSIWHENRSGNISSYPYSRALKAGASYNHLFGKRREKCCDCMVFLIVSRWLYPIRRRESRREIKNAFQQQHVVICALPFVRHHRRPLRGIFYRIFQYIPIHLLKIGAYRGIMQGRGGKDSASVNKRRQQRLPRS